MELEIDESGEYQHKVLIGPAATESQANEWAGSIQGLFTSMITPSGGGGSGGNAKVVEEVNGVMVKNMEKRKEMGDGDEEVVNKKDVAVEMYGKPAMRIIGGLADKWERAAK